MLVNTSSKCLSVANIGGHNNDKARKQRKDSVPLMTEHNVTEYFKSEANSKTIPDKKSVKKDLQQRHVLQTSLRRAWSN